MVEYSAGYEPEATTGPSLRLTDASPRPVLVVTHPMRTTPVAHYV